MTLTLAQFGDFFAELNGGNRPHAWQSRLAEHLVTTGSWPEVIDAPTGSGKSSVIDVHVFANAVAAAGGSELRPPRRLSVTVDRRALVDDNHLRAERIAATLRAAVGNDGVLGAAAEALASMRLATERPGDDGEAVLGVARLRGGSRPDRDWLDDPTACQVIAATPDMWGSRVLFGGYGSSRLAHPREAGLLVYDAVVVIDEAHLNRQLVETARQVGRMAAVNRGGLPVSPLQVTAMSATVPPGTASVVIGVQADDLKDHSDGALGARLTRPKPVRLRVSAHLPASGVGVSRAADEIVEEILLLLGSTHGTVGCVVNTVQLAVEVSSRLAKAVVPAECDRPTAGTTPVVETLVGRMRPFDVDWLRHRRPGLFGLAGDSLVDVVVATQTIEVGVDMDFAGLVTELASGSALAQRAGRVNRSGRRAGCPVVVLTPAEQKALDKPRGPYQSGDLRAAWAWLESRAQSDDGLAPWQLHPRGGGAVPPSEQPRRPVWHRPQWWNVRDWSRTAEDLFAPHELDLWLQDELSADLTAGLVVRRGLPASLASARAQVKAALPAAHEVFPVPVHQLREIVQSDVGLFDDGTPLVLVVRADDVLTWAEVASQEDPPVVRVRPGDVVVLSDEVATFTAGVATGGGRERAADVFEARLAPESGRGDGIPHRAVRIARGCPVFDGVEDGDVLLDELVQAFAVEAPVGDLVQILRGWLSQTGMPPSDVRDLLTAILAWPVPPIVTSPPAAGEDVWLIVSGPARAEGDEDVRQVWSPRHPVDLDDHLTAVASAAGDVAVRLRLPADLAQALVRAGELHDEGKRDLRFQRSLRAHAGLHIGRVLAKSGMRDTGLIHRARTASGLPRGWRHEQRSAAVAWSALSDEPAGFRDLVVRLVGTSHGHGRAAFDHVSDELLQRTADDGVVAPAAEELFDAAEWECLVERTDDAWGPWGCAYLEALLRAADCTISRSGS